jgi:hypothetical protein
VGEVLGGGARYLMTRSSMVDDDEIGGLLRRLGD